MIDFQLVQIYPEGHPPRYPFASICISESPQETRFYASCIHEFKKGQLRSLAKAKADKEAYSCKKKMSQSLSLSLPAGNPPFTKLFPSKRIVQIQEHLSELKRARQPQQ